MTLRNLTPDLPSLTSADLTPRSRGSQLGKRTHLTGAHSETEMEERGETKTHPYLIFSVRTGVPDLQPLCPSWTWSMLLSAGTLAVFFTTWRTFGFACTSSTLWIGEGGSFKRMKLSKKQDWSHLWAIRILKINREEDVKGNCHCGPRASTQ